jgi:hypothetical protein
LKIAAVDVNTKAASIFIAMQSNFLSTILVSKSIPEKVHAGMSSKL